VRILDLFCGAGGAAAGYARAGFEVVGVDLHPQPNYPYEFHQADAMTFPLDGFDAVHASPPCQPFTAYRRRDPDVVGANYLDLVDATRRALEATGLPYVIENVPGAPLKDPVQFCGSAFGLDVRRHRLFESNWPLVAPPCNHAWQTPRFPPATNRPNLRSTVEVGAYRCARLSPAAMRIEWMTNREISEAIPPAYTEFIGRQLRAHILAARGEAA
jgi:DNA (cytosine-5)-methyltransferase 1